MVLIKLYICALYLITFNAESNSLLAVPTYAMVKNSKVQPKFFTNRQRSNAAMIKNGHFDYNRQWQRSVNKGRLVAIRPLAMTTTPKMTTVAFKSPVRRQIRPKSPVKSTIIKSFTVHKKPLDPHQRNFNSFFHSFTFLCKYHFQWLFG